MPSRSIQFSGRCAAPKDLRNAASRANRRRLARDSASEPRTPRCRAAGWPIWPSFKRGRAFRALSRALSLRISRAISPGEAKRQPALPPEKPNADSARTDATGAVLSNFARRRSSSFALGSEGRGRARVVEHVQEPQRRRARHVVHLPAADAHHAEQRRGERSHHRDVGEVEVHVRASTL